MVTYISPPCLVLIILMLISQAPLTFLVTSGSCIVLIMPQCVLAWYVHKSLKASEKIISLISRSVKGMRHSDIKTCASNISSTTY
ncbi:hypothetical protein BDW22DRAFT_668250 [Trametopsis cervina]|nr:hypothetical protein BDW22DRAFT_668250 [Trametopsis cervina]